MRETGPDEATCCRRAALAARWRLGLGMSVALLGGCGAEDSASSTANLPESVATGVRVLLVGIDGAALPLIRGFAKVGALPHFADLLERGSSGPLLSVAPMYSPALWTEILTGKPREEHGIHFFTVPDDSEAGERLVCSSDRKTLALWNVLSAMGRRVGMVGFWATWPAEPVAGYLVSDRVARGRYTEWLGGRPGSGLTFPEDLLAAGRDLLVNPAEPDLSEFEQLVHLTDQERVEFLSASRPIQNHALSVLKFTFCAQRSYENIALHLLEERPQPDLFGIFLIANDPICHTFWHHFQPRAYGLPENAKARRLGAIIPAIQRHNDAVLGRLLAAVDENTVVLVVSDHGFQASGEPPQEISVEEYPELREAARARGRVTVGQTGIHHVQGLFLAAGGPIRAGVKVEARLADITPTILALLGIPVANDMPGRVLTEILEPEFLERFPLRRLDSYETRINRRRLERNPALDESLQLDQLRALGYIR